MKRLFIFAAILSVVMSAKAQFLDIERVNNASDLNLTGDNVEISRGYRGFVEVGYSIATTKYTDYEDYNLSMFTVSTTHGYQVIPNYLFVGAGVAYWNLTSYGESALPLFADVRSDFYSFGRWGFFADLKLGYSVAGEQGLFYSPKVGARYAITDKLGLNLGIGGTLFRMDEFSYDGGLGVGYFAINLGVDF
ncbi:MAG: hypothetical protein J1E29_02810 [Duncaniella sp.]|nr:hypothetical protein [Duncaniella sp.]